MAKKKPTSDVKLEEPDPNHPLLDKFLMWDEALNPKKDGMERNRLWVVFLAGVLAGTQATMDSLLKVRE